MINLIIMSEKEYRYKSSYNSNEMTKYGICCPNTIILGSYTL